MATEIKIDLQTDFAISQIERFNKTLNNTDKVVNQVGSDFKKYGDNFKKSTNESTKSVSTLNDSFFTLGSTIASVFAVNRIVSFFKEAVTEAQQFENALIGIKSVAGATGNNISEVESAVKKLASDGLIPVNEVANSLKSLLASGLNIEQSVNLFNALKDSASFNRQGFLSLGQAIEGATQGIKNGVSILVDNAGITKNLSILEKEYAESIGTTVGKLTEAQRIQARYVGILREASIFTGDAERLTQTFSGSVARLNANYTIFIQSIGQSLTRSIALNEVLSQTTRLFKALTIDTSNGASVFDNVVKFVLKVADITYRVLNVIQESLNAFLISIRGAILGLITVVEKGLNLLGGNFDFFTKKFKQNAVDFSKSTNSILSSFKESNIFSATIANINKEIEKGKTKQNEAQKVTLRNSNSQLEAVNNILNQEKKITGEKNNQVTLDKDALELAEARARQLGRVLTPASGLAQSVLSGNAKGFIGQGVQAIGGAFGPEGAVIAQAVAPILELASQGKEAISQAIKQFAEQLPDLLVNIIEGLAEAIPALIERLPLIIDRLVELTPRLITSLSEQMPRVGIALASTMPTVATNFAVSLIAEAPNIAKALIESIAKTASGATSFKAVGKFLKFSDGGIVGGGSFSGDRLLAGVNSGEMVLNRKQQANLFDLVSKGNGGNSDLTGLLNALVAQPIIVQVEGREIARVVRNQRKQGFII